MEWVWSVAFSPDGTTGQCSDDKISALAGCQYRSCLYNWGILIGSNLSPLSPDGNNPASGSRDHTVKLRNAKTGECLKPAGHTN